MHVTRFCLFLAISLFSVGSSGHHSNVGRHDRENVGEISGVVRDLLWANPHIFVDVETPAGEIWEIELQGPRQLESRGLLRSDVEPGAQVTFAGPLSLKTSTGMSGTNFLRPNCEEVVLDFGADRRWADCEVDDGFFTSVEFQADGSRPELGLFRVWVTGPDGLHPIGSGNPDDFPMNDAALVAFKEFDRAAALTTRGCVTKGMPTIMDNPLPYEFVEREDSIELKLEEYDAVRVIHMNRDSPPDGGAAFAYGPFLWSMGWRNARDRDITDR